MLVTCILRTEFKEVTVKNPKAGSKYKPGDKVSLWESTLKVGNSQPRKVSLQKWDLMLLTGLTPSLIDNMQPGYAFEKAFTIDNGVDNRC